MFNTWGSSGGPNLPIFSFYDTEEKRRDTAEKWRKKREKLVEKGLSRRTIVKAKKQMFVLIDATCKNPQGVPVNVLMDPLRTFLKKEKTKDWLCEEERAYYLLFAEKFCRVVNIKFFLLPKQLSEILKQEGIIL